MVLAVAKVFAGACVVWTCWLEKGLQKYFLVDFREIAFTQIGKQQIKRSYV